MNTFLITLGTVLVTLVVTSTAGYVLARTRFPGRRILAFYGPGRPHGYAREYSRAHSSAAALDDPLALHLADNATLRELYLDAEGEDGYYRDRNVFAPGVMIEDDMALLVSWYCSRTS